jgi:hypothetical protein
MLQQKARDAILVTTVFGALLLIPPILPFFDQPRSVFGAPLILVYVFSVWLALIGLTWWLSRRLPMDSPSESPLARTAADAVAGQED